MTRPIKFRAWDKINKEMVVEPSSIYFHDDGKIEVYPCHNDSEFVLMQFTGLTDKNGKEIYEGDIVKMMRDPIVPQYAICKVQWRNEYAGFNFSHIRLENIINPGEGWSPATHKGWEVIGNIYENPELLK